MKDLRSQSSHEHKIAMNMYMISNCTWDPTDKQNDTHSKNL